jgi:hypothetical protein
LDSSAIPFYFCRKRCGYNSVPNKDLHEYLIKLLDKIKRTSNDEINKLQSLRQVLVEKNLAGTYSDEIFKEQNANIEGKLTEAYEAQNDEITTNILRFMGLLLTGCEMEFVLI